MTIETRIRTQHYQRLPSAVMLITAFAARHLFADEDIRYPVEISCPYVSTAPQYSIASGLIPAPIEVATLASDKVEKTRISISTLFPAKDFDVRKVRLIAVTKKGKTIESAPHTFSEGEPIGQTTVKAEFEIGSGEIDRLRIQSDQADRHDPKQVESAIRTKVELVAVEPSADLIDRWGIINDPDGDTKIEEKAEKLTFAVPPGSHDLASGVPLNAPLVLNQVAGDFSIQVRVAGDFTPGKVPRGRGRPFVSAGILIWEDIGNYLRVERDAFWLDDGDKWCYPPLMEYWKDQKCVGFNLQPANADYFKGQSTSFKVIRKKKKVTVWMKHPDEEWKKIKSFPTELPEEVFVGVIAINTTDAGFDVAYDQFALEAERIVAPAIVTPLKKEPK